MLCCGLFLSVRLPPAAAAMLVPRLAESATAADTAPDKQDIAVALYRLQPVPGTESSSAIDSCAEFRSARRWSCASGPAADLTDGRSRAVADQDGPRISGRVTSADGFGIAGVTLIASRIAPSAVQGASDSADLRSERHARFRVVTDGAGFYSFDGIPDGIYTIRSSRHDEYESLRITVRTGIQSANLILTRN